MKNNLFLPADILLPNDIKSWPVIACDQYTSDSEYWEKVEKAVEGKASALNIIFPEIYLSDDNTERIEKINRTMKEYLSSDVFYERKNTFVYTVRQVSGGVRHGIVGLIDLEKYSFSKNSDAVIRATEATVTERIPPRVEIRKGAILEMPHVMLLIDDPDKTVIEPLEKESAGFETLYDTCLPLGGGNIKGMALDRNAADRVQTALENLYEKSGGMLFAVGDGNHSLAAAKECYRLDPTNEKRYALVEIVNIHEPSLNFEPIYRALFGVNPEEFINGFINAVGGEYDGYGAQKFTCLYKGGKKEFSVKPVSKLSVGTLQGYIDSVLKDMEGAKIDYIHGKDSAAKLAEKENTLVFLFEGMRKDELFPAVISDGSLPRKTFSMGEADDKRFYMECRKISK